MATFSAASKTALSTVHPALQRVFNEVIRFYDCAVLVGHRPMEEQNRAYAAGLSKLEWPNSKHNKMPSLAVDVAPYPINWSDTKRFYHFAGFVTSTAIRFGVNIRWGGDWDRDLDLNDQSFMDLVHFELVSA